ncbi:hypothetical protein [Paraburkholderia sp. SUR17]|uniref:hypothetical protein n=1 Tax=Paraburkholderia sp. SUR17 TaxID=3034358 RepID=UPI0024084FA5|nr:hypothetical protein [Paraburkholderia sp. SUR17]WEY42047.1 hypothetical protein P2869_18445 [Paraburkholderia sp. SUR17]
MTPPSDGKLALLEKQQSALNYALGRAEAEYKSYCDTWESIDRKAQATITLAGAFLAAVFAFIPRFDGRAEPLLIVGVIAVMLELLFTISAALLAIKPRGSNLPPCVEDFGPALISRIEKTESVEDFQAKQTQEYREWLEQWQDANDTVHSANLAKSACLQYSQNGLIVAAVCTVFIGVVVLISSTRELPTQTVAVSASLTSRVSPTPEPTSVSQPTEPTSRTPEIHIENTLTLPGPCCSPQQRERPSSQNPAGRIPRTPKQCIQAPHVP